MKERSTFILELRPLAHVDAIKSLRAALKSLSRNYGMECLQITQRPTIGDPNMIDLNDAKPQRDFELATPGIYLLRAKLKPGGAGEGGALRLSKNGCLEMIELECAIVGGEYAGQKVWDYISVNSLADDASLAISQEQIDKYKTAVDIGRTKLRALIESAREIDPKDDSAEAKKKRKLADYFDLDGLTFWVWLDIQQGKDGYRDKTVIDFIITPGSVEWNHRPVGRATTALRSGEMDDQIPF